MKKNVVWWPAVVNKDHMDKYGGYDYFQYSKNTWEYWCEKNNVLFVPFEAPVEKDLFRFRINWQKAIFVFVNEVLPPSSALVSEIYEPDLPYLPCVLPEFHIH